jgi:hypothetical protein
MVQKEAKLTRCLARDFDAIIESALARGPCRANQMLHSEKWGSARGCANRRERSAPTQASPMLVVLPDQSGQKTISRMRESRASAPGAASLDALFCECDKELSNRYEMSRSSALFDLYGGIRCSRERIRAYSLLGRKKVPCSPAQGFLLQDPGIQGLFDALFWPKEAESPALSPCSTGNLPSRGPPLPRLKEPRRLRRLDRRDPASGSSRLQCKI